MTYDADYFIRKFEAIPDDRWITHNFGSNGKHCALGHCGCTEDRPITVESRELYALFMRNINTSPSVINDGLYYISYQQDTAKGRILAVLKEIKEKEGK